MRNYIVAPLLALVISAGISAASAQGRTYNNEHVNWSPGGRQIAFVSDRTGDIEVYVMSADGSNVRRLTDAPGRDAHPAFSPDGRRIAFQSPRGGADTNIYVMNADGSAQTKITSLKGFAGVPCWSPDGRKILFQFRADSDGENKRWHIYVMNPDGSNLTRLTHDAANNQVPRWSPDGKRVLYFSDVTGKNQLYLMKPDGSARTRLTNNEYEDGPGDWSPDGRRVAFRSNRGGTRDVYVVDAEGTNATRVTSGVGGQFGAVVWAPGRKLLFSAPEGGKIDIFTVNPDGTGLARVTSTQSAAVDLEKEKDELLKVHEKDRRAHFETNPKLLIAHHPEEGLISVRNGAISRAKKADVRSRFEAYFKGAKYYEWDDLEPPIIRVSNDASMAWVIVRLRVRRTQRSATGAEAEEKFVYAGIMTYEKRGGQWVKIANVSTVE